MNQPNEVIQTMLLQFCGTVTRLKRMLGTEQVVFDNDTNMIKFDFKMCKKANYCLIRYDYGMDTYEMEFCRFNKQKMEWLTIKSFTDVYCDELTEIFESFTGLVLNYRPQFVSF